MSRHEFEQPGISVAIGWDAPLATFFLQVWSEALQTAAMDEEERASPQIWMGDEYGALPEPAALLAIARQHMPTLPQDLDEDLRQDRQAAPPRALPHNHGETVRFLSELLGACRQ